MSHDSNFQSLKGKHGENTAYDKSDKRHDLFRPEAIDGRRVRLDGEVIFFQNISIQFVAFLLFILIAAAVGVMSRTTYTRIETARGILATDHASTKIVASKPGEITKLLVSSGSSVAAGQQIAVISLDHPNGLDMNTLSFALQSNKTQHSIALDQLHLNKQRLITHLGQLTKKADNLSLQLDEMSSQLRIQSDLTNSQTKSFNLAIPVAEKGFMSRLDLERRRLSALSSAQQLSQLRQQKDTLHLQLITIADEKIKAEADAGSRTAQIMSDIQRISQERLQLLSQQSYTIRSPIAGKVTALQVSNGRFVEGGVPLMSIIPTNGHLHADLYVLSKSIGLLKLGQNVRLKYDSFPYARFGSFAGSISDIDRVPLVPNEVLAPIKIEDPVYRVRVSLKDQAIYHLDDKVLLQQGMSFTADIVVKKQSFFSWFIEPLTGYVRKLDLQK